MGERRYNPDQYGLGLGPLVLLWLVIAFVCAAGAYVVWFLATHWHTIFPR
jgi:hypothetical protein